MNEQISLDGRIGNPSRIYAYRPGTTPPVTRFPPGQTMTAAPDDVTAERAGRSWDHIIENWAKDEAAKEPLRWVWLLGNALINEQPAAAWQIIDAERPEVGLAEVSLDLVTVLERAKSDVAQAAELVTRFLAREWDAD